jgi:hypothetical protein
MRIYPHEKGEMSLTVGVVDAAVNKEGGQHPSES